MSSVVDLFTPERRRRAFPTGPWFFRISFSLGRQRDRKTILEKGAWSRRLVTVCSMKYERENLIKTFSTRFAWTLTRRLLTQRRQGEFYLLAFWRNIRNWKFLWPWHASAPRSFNLCKYKAIDSELVIKISDFMFFSKFMRSFVGFSSPWFIHKIIEARSDCKLLRCVWVYSYREPDLDSWQQNIYF